MAATFLEAILEGGIEHPNFFNGKVLTARDLRDLQASTSVRARRLGLAAGEGVAYGLFVKASGSTALSISAGLAINRRGDTLLLPADTTLPLQASQQASAPLDSPFKPCEVTLVTTSVAVGFFLLAITPATELSRAQAQHTGLNTGRATCTSRYEVEGVQFKLVTIDPAVFTPSGSNSLHRSQLVQACFGTATLQANSDNPFQMPAYYGLVDNLRASGKLLDCDVPLAVLLWSGSQIRFVDPWAVRRPCYGVSATAAFPFNVSGVAPFPQHASPRRRVEAQARLLQFQDQLEDVPRNQPVAQNFVFLPAAGYLPRGKDGFSLGQFFPQNTSLPRELDPAFLRLVFEQSFFIEPVPVTAGQPVEVEFFRVAGAGEAWIVFARREQVTVRPPGDDDEPGLPGPVEKAGTLVVTVTDPKGLTLLDSDIQEVKVSNASFPSPEPQHEVLYADAGPTYNVATQNQIKYSYQQAKKQARRSPYGPTAPGGVPGFAEKDPAILKAEAAVYVFKRPPGLYTVAVIPIRSTGLRPNSMVIRLSSGQTKAIKLTLPERVRSDPSPGGKIRPGLEAVFVLPQGHLVDEITLYPDWPERYPRDPGYIDPPPDDWLVEPTPGVKTHLEDILGQHVLVDPTIAAEDPRLFTDPAYEPDVIQEAPYAFVQTGDGRVIPLIYGAGSSAIRGEVAVGQAGLADLDAHTQSVLRGHGLDSLNTFNGAWTGLIGGVLHLDKGGARSLLAETRAAGQGFKGSFTRYPGTNAQADAALKASNIGDDVALANAPVAAVLAALNSAAGANFTEGFAIRLIDRARGNVPESAWTLGSLGLSAGQIETLSALDITSAGQLALAAGEKRAEIQGLLNLTDSALERLGNEARAGVLGSRLQQAGSLGVAQVGGVGGNLAATLVSAGYQTAADLSNADAAELAQIANISAAEAGALKQSAAEMMGTLALLQAEFGLAEAEVKQLKEAGIASARDLVAAPETIRKIVGGDRAGTVSMISNLILTRLGARRLR